MKNSQSDIMFISQGASITCGLRLYMRSPEISATNLGKYPDQMKSTCTLLGA